VLLTLGLVTALAPTAVAQPTVEVTVDGTEVRAGGTVTVTDDPVVAVDIEGNESIRSVTIRIDGEPRRSVEPNATNVSERFTLDLTDGDHTMVVVVDGDDRLTATIRKDSTGPLVTYTSPFQSTGAPPTGAVAIDRAETTLSAELSDLSGVREVRIERIYEWRFAGRARRDVATSRIENPGDNVSQPLLFGLGRNELHVTAIDVHGQRRTHDITVWLLDNRDPEIDLDRFERAGGDLHVAGTVRDNVKVNSLSYRVVGTAQKRFVLNPTSAEPIRSRLAVDFAFTVPIGDRTETIVLEATDVAGNELSWSLPLDYRGHLVPTVTVAEAVVNGSHVDVAGTVTDGQVTRVVVESVGPDGTVVDSRTIYDGDPTSHVVVRERVAAAAGETTVVIRAVDAEGRDHRASRTLTTPVAAPVTDASTVTATPTSPVTPTPTPATTGTDGADTERGTTSDDGALPGWAVVGGVLLGLLLVARARGDAG
jgi:hypothetical protein